MPRKETVDLVMRRSYRNRDVETFIWSCLKLTEEEIKNKVKVRTFNGRDIVGFVNTLVNLERVRKDTIAVKVDDAENFGDWGKPPEEAEEEDDETVSAPH